MIDDPFGDLARFGHVIHPLPTCAPKNEAAGCWLDAVAEDPSPRDPDGTREGDEPVIEIDPEVDAAYITLQPISDGEAVRQIVVDDARLHGEVVLDLDAHGRLLGIELIGYRSLLEGGCGGEHV